MELARSGIIAVTHEEVAQSAFLGCHTPVDQWTTSLKLRNEQLLPLFISHIVTSLIVHEGVIAEVVDKRLTSQYARSGAVVMSIAHVRSHSAVIHQCSHGILLLFGSAVCIFIEHITPIIFRCTEIGTIFWMVDIGVGACALDRPSMILHHLCHTRSDTSCDSSLAINNRTICIIWCILVPFGLDQWFHTLAHVAIDRCSHTALGHLCRSASLQHGRHLGCKKTEPIPESVRHVTIGHISLRRISKHILKPVIARNNDKTVALAHITYIVCRDHFARNTVSQFCLCRDGKGQGSW